MPVGDLGGLDAPHQFDQRRLQDGKQLFDLLGCDPHLVVLQQGVIRLVLEAVEPGFLPFHVDDFLQVGREPRVVVLSSGLLPDMLGLGGQPGQFTHKFHRQGGSPAPVVPDVFQQPHLTPVQAVPVNGPPVQVHQGSQALAKGVTGEAGVGQGEHQGNLLRPGLGAAGWHVSLLVPGQHGGHLAQLGDHFKLGDDDFQFAVHAARDSRSSRARLSSRPPP